MFTKMHTSVQGEDKQRRENKQSSPHKELQCIKQNSLVTGSLQKNTAVILPTLWNYTVQQVVHDGILHRFKSKLLNFPFIVFPMVSQSESLFGESNVLLCK